MSQTITPPGPGGGTGPARAGYGTRGAPPNPYTAGTVPPPEPGPVARALATLRHSLEGTPGRLRLAAGAAIVAALVAGIGGGFALFDRDDALSDARESAANLVLVQGIRTNLGQADADATNAFLRFGLEPAGQQRDYVASLQAASSDLTKVARGADEADAEVLSQVNDRLTVYAGLIESARANNRQNLPVGANYLSTASALLTTEVLGPLERVADNEERRTDEAYERAGLASAWLAIAVVVGLGTLIGIQVWLARRSRRVLNVPAAAATALLLVAVIIGATVMSVAQSQAKDVRDGVYDRAVGLGQARVDAFAAKSQEALTLIRRGSDDGRDSDWAPKFRDAESGVRAAAGGTALADSLESYGEAHAAIRALDQQGDWDGAVELAIATGDDSANAAFARFSGASLEALRTDARSTDDGLREAAGGLTPAGWALILAGLLAAGGAWWGISLRLDEYR